MQTVLTFLAFAAALGYLGYTLSSPFRAKKAVSGCGTGCNKCEASSRIAQQLEKVQA